MKTFSMWNAINIACAMLQRTVAEHWGEITVLRWWINASVSAEMFLMLFFCMKRESLSFKTGTEWRLDFLVCYCSVLKIKFTSAEVKKVNYFCSFYWLGSIKSEPFNTNCSTILYEVSKTITAQRSLFDQMVEQASLWTDSLPVKMICTSQCFGKTSPWTVQKKRKE